MESSWILVQLKQTMKGLDKADVADLAKRGKEARHLINRHYEDGAL